MPRRRRFLTRLIGFLFLGLMTMGLTACNVSVSTKLIINADGSGERQIVATVSKEDIAKAVGGAAAIENSIKASCPKELSYEGTSADSSKGTVYTFKLAFKDQAEYLDKATKVLAAGGPLNDKVRATVEVFNSPFRTGVNVQESFTSKDLLKWLGKDLVTKGVVSDSDKNTYISTAESQIVSKGVGHKEYEPFRYSDVESYGFSEVQVLTAALDQPQYTRTITYTMTNEKYQHNPKAVDDWLAQATPDGGKLSKGGSAGTSWTITFSGTPTDIQTKTDKALGAPAGTSKFSLTTKTGSSPMSLVTTVSEVSSCNTICDNPRALSTFIEPPSAWSTRGSNMEPSKLRTQETGTTISRSVSFSSAVAKLDLTNADKPAASVILTLPKMDADLVGASVEKWLNQDPASFAANSGDDQVTYVLSFSGDDAEALMAAMDSYAVKAGNGAGKGNQITTIDHGGLFRATAYDRITITILEFISSSSSIPKTAELVISYPSGTKVESTTLDSAKIDNTTVTVPVGNHAISMLEIKRTHMSWVGYAVVAGSLLLLAGAVFFLVRLAKPKGSQPGAAYPQAAPMQPVQQFIPTAQPYNQPSAPQYEPQHPNPWEQRPQPEQPPTTPWDQPSS